LCQGVGSDKARPPRSDHISFVFRSQRSKVAYAVKIPRIRVRAAAQRSGGRVEYTARAAAHLPAQSALNTEGKFWTNKTSASDKSWSHIGGRGNDEGMSNLRATWNWEEGKRSTDTRKEAPGDLRSSFIDLRNSFPEIPWLLGSQGASQESMARNITARADVHPEEAQAMFGRLPSKVGLSIRMPSRCGVDVAVESSDEWLKHPSSRR
jgi:hypothetical protein